MWTATSTNGHLRERIRGRCRGSTSGLAKTWPSNSNAPRRPVRSRRPTSARSRPGTRLRHPNSTTSNSKTRRSTRSRPKKFWTPCKTEVSKTCRNQMTTEPCPRSCARCASSKTTWTRRRRYSRTRSDGGRRGSKWRRSARSIPRRRCCRIPRGGGRLAWKWRRSGRNAMIVRRRCSKVRCGGATPSRRSRSEDANGTTARLRYCRGLCDGATPAPKWSAGAPRRRSTKSGPRSARA
mmetsp:Transcript_4266/g.12156  ORF Transcript_4266/g.12156 Transcript_4266/m.12156 type:complete len:237 (+) Transcript_4266:1008-1718(+)